MRKKRARTRKVVKLHSLSRWVGVPDSMPIATLRRGNSEGVYRDRIRRARCSNGSGLNMALARRIA